MFCKILSIIYGRDTRPVQSLNIVMAIVWLFMYWLSIGGTVVDLPNNHSEIFVTTLSALIVIMAPMAIFLFTCRAKQVAKAFTLMLGALLHAVVANGYISKYPPLDMMMVVSVLTTLLFGGAALYIFKCEGLDVVPVSKR